MTTGTPRLRLSGIAKRFGAVRAIQQADLVIREGRVHALVGENGAGKSTMIKIVSGAETADAGTIEFDGEPVRIGGTNDAIALGIATVYQEPQLFGELTVAENIFLGREITRAGRIDWAAQQGRVAELLERLGLPARSANAAVNTLSVAEQQQVSIAKALATEARVLILDEPSAILTDAEIDVLFDVVRRLTAAGVAVIYISHRLDELFRIADEVTVMRDGKTIGTYDMSGLTVRRIAELMVGGVLSDERPHRVVPDGPAVLELRGLGRAGRFADVDVTVRGGEIVALYGLVGSGVSEIAAAVYGIDRITAGEIHIGGERVTPRSPAHAQRLGVALLPANRKVEGIFGVQSIAFNISAGHLRLLSRFGTLLDRGRERGVALDLIRRLSVKTPSERQPISAMSGGNAQKVVLARQLVERPRVLILAEPTQGVDVGAKEEIHRIVTELADSGTAVLVVTSDLPEALRIADRIQVVRGGTTTMSFGPDASQVDLLAAAAGGDE
ncbi:ABC transporter ATP-binding protein [Actinoplanes sp. SE50]|uniref:sugar ABC transporter ATP-binding protein n=1 Tax=unclassified Actinoplanes TaxID=2626549 RepID=UPI00023ED3E8|nr:MULTISPECIES: sugar ABC transporter ATP-binding protein [unclassified Actinoplanes]AEV83348.1 ribose transport system ATP-binding protein [Actinoplanes sp. SE50/110]ATO81741.1 ABC transporter ATP-binding protein [Actinoplanes sp. SE50]SLL99149.1 ABC transporter ATP-binding protein [Actinoplanes sp. SE50/110]